MELKSTADFLAQRVCQKREDDQGLLSIAGFGSLLSFRSARSTFPDLRGFHVAKVKGFRRVFAHTAAVFHKNGIARPATREISSLSCEECPGQAIFVSLFQINSDTKSIQAFIEREHEFRFLAVPVESLNGNRYAQNAVLCGRWNDTDYRAERCPPEEFHERYGQYGLKQVWSDDVLPCRVYLRHCVLAAEGLGLDVHDSFLDHTFLADRATTVRAHLEQHPEIMEELPPAGLRDRYSG